MTKITIIKVEIDRESKVSKSASKNEMAVVEEAGKRPSTGSYSRDIPFSEVSKELRSAVGKVQRFKVKNNGLSPVQALANKINSNINNGVTIAGVVATFFPAGWAVKALNIGAKSAKTISTAQKVTGMATGAYSGVTMKTGTNYVKAAWLKIIMFEE